MPDDRFEWLVSHWKPASSVSAYLTVLIDLFGLSLQILFFKTYSEQQITDIAGLVRGASTGEGLGNAFLSHIRAVDGIFHVISELMLTRIRIYLAFRSI